MYRCAIIYVLPQQNVHAQEVSLMLIVCTHDKCICSRGIMHEYVSMQHDE